MRMRGPNSVERAVQTATLLRYLKKFGEMLTQKFDRVKTLRNNSQQHATTSNNMQQSVQTDVCLPFRFFFC